MAFEITSLEGSGKNIIQRVMNAKKSQLLIPPKLKGIDISVAEPPADGKYIGLFSSGTTSEPVCIWNSMDRLNQNAEYSANAFGVKSRHLLLMMAMPWHVAGFSWMLMAELLDCEYFFITTKKGEHDLWIKTVKDIEPDYLLTVPAVLRALYGEDWFVPNVAYGGYPIKFEEYEKLSPHCSFMYQGYGQTEAGGLISSYKRRSTVIPNELENLCQGQAIEGVELKCDGTKDQPESIFIKSETAFQSGFYDSGDVGFLDDRDNVFVMGRSIDSSSINHSGKKELLGN